MSRRVRIYPREALLNVPDLCHGLLRNCQWLSQHSHVAQLAGYHVQIALFIDDKLGHKAVQLFNAVLGEIAGETEILSSCTTGSTILMGTEMPHHRHCQVAWLDITHLRTHLDDLTEHLVPDHQI